MINNYRIEITKIKELGKSFAVLPKTFFNFYLDLRYFKIFIDYIFKLLNIFNYLFLKCFLIIISNVKMGVAEVNELGKSLAFLPGTL